MIHHDIDHQKQTTADRNQNEETLKGNNALEYTVTESPTEKDEAELDIMDILLFNHPK